FGVLLYEYACGVHPFGGSSPLAIVARVLDSDARPIESRRAEIPEVVAAAIARCLQKAPADRFRSAAEIVDALRTADRAVRPPPHDACAVRARHRDGGARRRRRRVDCAHPRAAGGVCVECRGWAGARLARPRAGDDGRRLWRGRVIAIEISRPGDPDVLVPVE